MGKVALRHCLQTPDDLLGPSTVGLSNAVGQSEHNQNADQGCNQHRKLELCRREQVTKDPHEKRLTDQPDACEETQNEDLPFDGNSRNDCLHHSPPSMDTRRSRGAH